MHRFISLACLLGLVACANHDREPDMAPASGMSQPTARSVERLTAERCAREAKCDNIGSDRKFSSQDDCRSRMQDDAYDALSPPGCKAGVDHEQLAECLEAIRDEDCGDVLDSIERIADCRAPVLCAD